MERYPSPNMASVDQTLGVRAVAMVIDGLLMTVVSLTVIVFLGTSGLSTFLPGMVNANLLWIFTLLYYVGMEGHFGYTVGKYEMGLVVVGEDGDDCDMGASLLRNVLRLIDILPMFYLLGAVVVYLTEDGKRVGDIAASTIVVKRQ